MPSVEWNKRWGREIKNFTSSRKQTYYGLQWGDPARSGFINWFLQLLGKRRDLSRVHKEYLKPYVTAETVVMEIGVGGGRWTQYMLQAKELILVDLNAEFFPYLKQRFEKAVSKLRFYQTQGYELDGIAADAIDFVFSYGTFVHIDPAGIDSYLGNIKRVMKPSAVAVIHYADRSKKYFEGREGFEHDEGNPQGFSNMNPQKMEGLLAKHGFHVLDHNVTLLKHSSIVVIQKTHSF